jgi:phenylalanyl-tRNA synthetase alpha chain
MTQPDALHELVSSAQASFAQALTPADLENAKAQFLGKTGRVTELMKGMAALSVEEKKSRGAAINLAKQAIEAALTERRQALADAELAKATQGRSARREPARPPAHAGRACIPCR